MNDHRVYEIRVDYVDGDYEIHRVLAPSIGEAEILALALDARAADRVTVLASFDLAPQSALAFLL